MSKEELNYSSLNAELNLFDSEGKIQFEKDKKAQQPAIQTDKNYTTPSSGFRRF